MDAILENLENIAYGHSRQRAQAVRFSRNFVRIRRKMREDSWMWKVSNFENSKWRTNIILKSL